jgi:hypothetical protein
LSLLPFWLLGILHLVLWVKIHSSEVGAECDAANTVLSLITSALFLCTPYFHMLWVIHSECVMGEWAKTLLFEEAERARHDTEAGLVALELDKSAQSSNNLSKRKTEPSPTRGKRGGEDHSDIEEMKEEDKLIDETLKGMSPEEVQMISSWREHAASKRLKGLAFASRCFRAIAFLCMLYALWGTSDGWWPYCTRKGDNIHSKQHRISLDDEVPCLYMQIDLGASLYNTNPQPATLCPQPSNLSHPAQHTRLQVLAGCWCYLLLTRTCPHLPRHSGSG